MSNNYIIKRDKEEKYKFSGDNEILTGSSLIELQVFQSFLYVTREPYQNTWLIDAFSYLESNVIDKKIDTSNFLSHLKVMDNNRCETRNSTSFQYGDIDRYWFWRLDYYLWEKRSVFFYDKSLEIANRYVFRANRSTEHIAPQNPKRHSVMHIDKSLMNSFGNLAMISSGQNSSLQNESFEIKRAHVESFILGNINGTIESLKMLDIYEFENWNDENLMNHNNKMMQALIDSFPETYVEIRKHLGGSLKNDNYHVKDTDLEYTTLQ